LRGFIKFCSIVIIMLVLSKSQAQESGVLLGLRFFRNDEPHYRTLWIAPENGEVNIVAEGKGLLVPRKTGFWRVGIEREVYENWEEDFPWASPVEKVPVIQEIDPEEVEECEAENRSIILFVGNDYVSLEKESSGYCKGAAHPWCSFWLEVSSLDSLGMKAKCVPISAVMDTAGTQAMQRGAKSYYAGLDDDKKESLEEAPNECGWGLIRRKGSWVLRGRLVYSYEVFRGQYGDYDIPMDPPASLVSHDNLYPSWDVIKKAVPDAIDGFSSPLKDLLVVLTRTKMLVFINNEEELVKPVLEIELNKRESAVMIQWATGNYVDRWSEEVKKFLSL